MIITKVILLGNVSTYFLIFGGGIGSFVREEKEGKEAKVGICLCFGDDDEEEKEDEETEVVVGGYVCDSAGVVQME